MADEFATGEVIQRIRSALSFAFADAFIDDEIGVEDFDGEESPTITLVQYSLETNEPIARFTVGFTVEGQGDA